jgi:hypothetical protein
MAAKKLRPVHPGDILRNEFLEPLGLTAYGRMTPPGAACCQSSTATSRESMRFSWTFAMPLMRALKGCGYH